MIEKTFNLYVDHLCYRIEGRAAPAVCTAWVDAMLNKRPSRIIIMVTETRVDDRFVLVHFNKHNIIHFPPVPHVPHAVLYRLGEVSQGLYLTENLASILRYECNIKPEERFWLGISEA